MWVTFNGFGSSPAGVENGCEPKSVTHMKNYLEKTLKSRFAISCVGGVESD